jgi:hypothetical protein
LTLPLGGCVQAELSQNPFISPSDIIILLLCMFITPLYFVYIRVDNEELAARCAPTPPVPCNPGAQLRSQQL